jgi:hypothetical protein
LTDSSQRSRSVTPWIFDLAIFRNASTSDLEGDYYLTTLVGALAFIVTGPLVGIVLGRFIRDKTITFWTFAGLLFLVAVPVLGFQILAYSSSILSAFMVGGPWRNGLAPFQ